MPFDANGNFSLVPGTIVADGMNVLPSQHNPPFQDVANGLSQAVVRDGRAPMTGPLNMNGNKITGVAAGDAPDDVVTNAAIADLGVAIGDGAWSVRDLSPNWLRRDGKLYDINEYPDLAELLPELPDGVSWSNQSSSITGISDIITHEDGYVLGAVSGSDTLIYASPDAKSWSLKGTVSAFTLERIATGNGIFIAVDGNGHTARSNDLQTWSKSTGTFSGGATGIAFGDGVFVAVGTSGQVKTTEDGSSWTNRTSNTTNLLNAVRFLNGVFVAVGGGGGTIISSADGQTWTLRTTGTTSTLNDVAFGAGRYVAVGASGAILTSADLSSWSLSSSGTTSALNSVVYSSSGFLTAGAGGVARISNNGISWTTSATGVSFLARTATFDPSQENRYIVGGGSVVLEGIRTLPTQFRVPNDDPTYGWIRAL